MYIEDKIVDSRPSSANNLKEAVEEYGRYYSNEDEKKYGVLGISFEVVSS